MADNTVRYPEPPAILTGGWNWQLLKYFGAGAILASVTIGSGETLMSSRGGAIFGYSLLWCMLAASITKGVQVYTAARYMTLTGEHPMEHWAKFPGPPKWIPIVMVMLCLWCFPTLLAFLCLVMGEIINDMFHVVGPDAAPEVRLFWTRIWATLGALVAITLTLLQSYGFIEKIQTAVVGLLLVSIGAACLASNPDWLQALIGTLVPRMPRYEPWVLEKYGDAFADRPPWVEITAIVGFIGGGSYDYLGYIGCLREKSWGAIGRKTADDNSSSDETDSYADGQVHIATDDENVRRGRIWLRPAAIDVLVSFGCVFLFSVFFVVLGAVVLYPQQTIPSKEGELLSLQSQFLTRFHPSLLYLYQAGVFTAFWGTIYGAYEIYSRTMYECIRPVSQTFRKMSPRRVQVMVLAYCGIVGLILTWNVEKLIPLMTFPSLMGGVLSCGLWCFGMIWLDRTKLPPQLRMSKLLTVMTAISGLILTGMGLKALIDFALSFWPAA